MLSLPYVFERERITRYTLTSIGKETIRKIVEFTPTKMENVYNLGFGDLLANGEMDDTANTNNGDIIKVLSTVIHILKDFIKETGYTIIFAGSTENRTSLYNRILKTYFHQFSEEFIITAIEESGDGLIETPFNPTSNTKYLAFLVKRID